MNATPDNAISTETPPPAAPRTPRFVYPGGARPLPGFVLKRGVGQGGFGEIYFAVSDAGKEVALKLIRRNLDVELRGIRQCLNLKHPNLVDLYDIRQDEQGDTWVVMEFVDGPSLESVLAQHPRGMPPALALHWLAGVAAGVCYLHDRGIVHRDLKPGNIFIADDLVKVGDYGLSKFIACSRRSGQTESVGTVHYMAPEVANGRYGKEIDVYALGVMLYEMLTGRVPFDGESIGEVLMKHLTAQPDLSALAEPYRSAVGKALYKDPQERYRNVEEMLAALPAPQYAKPAYVRMPPEVATQGVALNDATPAAAADAAKHGAADRAVVTAAVAEPASPDRAVFDAGHATASPPPLPPPLPAHDLGSRIDEATARIGRRMRKVVPAGWQASDRTIGASVLIAIAMFTAIMIQPPTSRGVTMFGAVALVAIVAYYFVRRSQRASLADGEQTPPGPSAGDAGARCASPAVAPPIAPAPPPPLPAAAARWVSDRRGLWRLRATPALVLGTPAERAAELLTSLLVAALATSALYALFWLAGAAMNAGARPEVWAWAFGSSVFGAWTVLIVSKPWEGTAGEPFVRRFVMLFVGLGLGLAVAALADFLLAQPPRLTAWYEPAGYQMPSSFYSATGQPLWPAFGAVFAALLALVRWWRMADPMRRKRVKIWSAIGAGIVASVVAALGHFPEPWLVLIAIAMALSIQLASPWRSPAQRERGHNR